MLANRGVFCRFYFQWTPVPHCHRAIPPKSGNSIEWNKSYRDPSGILTMEVSYLYLGTAEVPNWCLVRPENLSTEMKDYSYIVYRKMKPGNMGWWRKPRFRNIEVAFFPCIFIWSNSPNSKFKFYHNGKWKPPRVT